MCYECSQRFKRIDEHAVSDVLSEYRDELRRDGYDFARFMKLRRKR